MNFTGANFNVAQPHLFNHSMEGMRKSLSTPDHFFCSNNVILEQSGLIGSGDSDYLYDAFVLVSPLSYSAARL